MSLNTLNALIQATDILRAASRAGRPRQQPAVDAPRVHLQLPPHLAAQPRRQPLHQHPARCVHADGADGPQVRAQRGTLFTFLLYWYKSTNTDAKALCCEQLTVLTPLLGNLVELRVADFRYSGYLLYFFGWLKSTNTEATTSAKTSSTASRVPSATSARSSSSIATTTRHFI
jgi:hypothetical protein